MECDHNRSSSKSLRVDAAELASLVDDACSVTSKLCQIAATREFVGFDLADLQSLRDWVDRGYVTLVELAQAAADRVDAELDELGAPSAPTRP